MLLKQLLLANACHQRERERERERERHTGRVPRVKLWPPHPLPFPPAWGIAAGTRLISSSNTGRVIWNIYEASNLS